MAALGLRGCSWALVAVHRLSLAAGSEGGSPVSVGMLLVAAASAVAEHRLWNQWAQ